MLGERPPSASHFVLGSSPASGGGKKEELQTKLTMARFKRATQSRASASE